ncbi:UNVERIFIED_CONTAM: S-type anion channel SLAH3 [Sesamum calycinum]|uniref:S-type anion channel SLAH3 n=1 Tax=Sesamum calycinum TaxID=2727403 RepID=A0AAW2RR46_9LAMI
MESSKENSSPREDSPEELPSLIRAITAHEVAGFDSLKDHDDLKDRLQSTGFHPPSASVFGIEAAELEIKAVFLSHKGRILCPSACRLLPLKLTYRTPREFSSGTQRQYWAILYQILLLHIQTLGSDETGPLLFSRYLKENSRDKYQICVVSVNLSKVPMLSNLHKWKVYLLTDTLMPWRDQNWIHYGYLFISHWSSTRNYAVSLTLKQFSAGFRRLLLPDDKQWPFLLRFPMSSFGICLGVSSQAIMWKTLASSESTKFLHVSLDINLVLWFISVALVVIVAAVYALKVIFYFEAVRREYYHPIRVNFFFAPWIALLFLALGIPPSFSKTLHASLWYILMTPIFFLELKIYGQWMSGGQRRLSKVANPSNHLSIVGNFVGALLGASMGLKEGPVFFFAVGLAHYTVLFVTLYQRLPTNETLPKELHPVFFLFVAAPSVASMAWARIQGSFDNGSRIAYFIALFLYFSLVCSQ